MPNIHGQPDVIAPLVQGRRRLLGLAAAGLGLSMLPSASRAGTTCSALGGLGLRGIAPNLQTVDLVLNFGADPTGAKDSSAALQAALTYLASAGGGVLTIPPGNFAVNTPVSYSGGNLTILGPGQGTVTPPGAFVTCVLKFGTLAANQAGIAISPNGTGCVGATPITAGAVETLAAPQSIVIRNLSFSVSGGSTNSSVIQISNAGSAAVNCLIEDLSFAAVTGGNPSVVYGISLSSVTSASIRNCTQWGGSFVSLSTCTDIVIESCSVIGLSTGIAATGGSRLHIDQFVFLGMTAINASAVTGLYVSHSELNCNTTSTVPTTFTQVATGWVSHTHFGNPATLTLPSLLMSGCSGMQIANCNVSGAFGSGSSAAGIGIQVTNGSIDNEFNEIEFGNLSTGLLLSSGVSNNTGRHLTICCFTGNQVGLVGVSGFVGGLPTWSGGGTGSGFPYFVFNDQSGNTTNELEILSNTTNSGSYTTTARLGHTQTQ